MVCIQYVNPACAKALNYSAPGELVGRHVDEAVTSDKNPIDIYGKIQQQLEAGQVQYTSLMQRPYAASTAAVHEGGVSRPVFRLNSASKCLVAELLFWERIQGMSPIFFTR